MALSSGRAQDIVQEWNLRTGKAVRSVDELYRSIRKEQVAEKKLTVVRAELDRQTNTITSSFQRMNQSVTSSLSQMTSGMMMSTMKGQLLTNGIMALGDSLAQSAKDSVKFAQAQAIFTGDLYKARVATKGLASDLDLMVAKNRLATLGVKMSDDQYAEMLGNLTKLSAAMSIDLDFALESATTMLARQSTAVADNVGVVIKAEEAYAKYAISIGKAESELTPSERKIAFQTEALRQMSEKAAELPPVMESAGSELKNFTNEWKNFTNEIGGAIAKSSTLVDSMKGIAAVVRMTAYGIDELNENISNFVAGINRATRERGKLLGTDEQVRKKIEGQADIFRGGSTVLGGGFGEAGAEFGLMGAPKTLGISEEGTGKKRGRAVGARRARKKGKKTALEVFEDLTQIDPGEVREVSAELLAEIERLEVRRAELMEGPSPMAKAAEEIFAMGEAQRQSIELNMQLGNVAATQGERIKNAFLDAMIGPDTFRTSAQGAQDALVSMSEIGDQALASFTGSLWSAAAQAIESGESFSGIALKMLKPVLIGLASDLTARGIAALITGKALAINPFTAAAAPFFFAQGNMFLGGAAVVGGLGLAMSAASAISGGGSGGVKNTTVTRPATSAPVSQRSYQREQRPKFADEKKVEEGPKYIQVYIGDPGSPTAYLLATKQMDGQINRVTQAKFSEI